MALVNEHFLKLQGSYLFSDIAKKVKAYQITHPNKRLIRLGIGDVTRPLPMASIEAMHHAVDELAHAKTFHGYGPEQGYDFLIETIIKHDFTSRQARLHLAGHSDQPIGSIHQRRSEERYGKHRRTLALGQ